MSGNNLPFKSLIRTLAELTEQKKTGTLFIVGDETHSIQFKLDQGLIVAIVYGHLHGLAAAKQMKTIQTGRYSFSNHLSLSKKQQSQTLQSNEEIFKILGFCSDNSIENQTKTANNGKKILVIDDSNIARKVAMRTLAEQGYLVDEAKDGIDGLSRIAKNKPDLILLDIIMPGMDGYKLLSLIKNNPEFKNIPVVMLTARNKLFDKIKGKMSASNEYLTKPFVAEELLTIVNRLLFHSNGQSI